MADKRRIKLDADLVDMAAAWGILPDKTPGFPKPREKTRPDEAVPPSKKPLEGIDLGRKDLRGMFEARNQYGRSKSIAPTRNVVRGERRP